MPPTLRVARANSARIIGEPFPIQTNRCRTLYRDSSDNLSQKRKLEILREWTSIGNIVDWQDIKPNRHHDRISHRDQTFETLYPMGPKSAKASKDDEVIFALFQIG